MIGNAVVLCALNDLAAAIAPNYLLPVRPSSQADR